MTAGSEALVLKITADTGEVAAGLAPMTKALDKLGDEADEAAKDLRELSDTDVKFSVKDQALQRARQRIDELRNDIARDVVLGVDTKAAQREISNLQTAMRRLEDKPPRIEPVLDDSKMDTADALEGIDSLREGALQLGDALGNLDGSFGSIGAVVRESVPALADLNQTLVAMRLRAEATGASLGRVAGAASRVTSVVAGPWGLAIAAGAGLLAAFATRSDEAEAASRSFAESIDFQAGAFSRANREAVASQLVQKDTLKEAERLGIVTQDLVTALLEGGDASRLMRERLQTMFDNAPAFSQAENDAKDLLAAYDEMSGRLVVAKAITETTARAIGDVGDAAVTTGSELDAMTGGVSHNADVWEHFGKEVDDSRRALDEMIGSLDILNGRFATVREATSNYEQALDDVNAAIEENGKAVTKGGKAFDVSSKAGRDNEKALLDMAKAAEDLTRARLADADASGESTDDIMADYEKQRESLYKTARRMGLSEQAADDYVESLLATPDELTTALKFKDYQKRLDEAEELAKDREAVVTLKLNKTKFLEDLARARAAARAELPGGALSANPSSVAAPPAAAPSAGLTLLQPRLYLDSRPIRYALRNDVASTVATQLATTRKRGRL